MLHFMLFQLIITSWFANYVEGCDFDHMDVITAWCAFVCFYTLCLKNIEIYILSHCIIPHNEDDTPQNMFRSVRTPDHHNKSSFKFFRQSLQKYFWIFKSILQNLFSIFRLRLQLFRIWSNHYNFFLFFQAII